jgi:hypothetical protein
MKNLRFKSGHGQPEWDLEKRRINRPAWRSRFALQWGTVMKRTAMHAASRATLIVFLSQQLQASANIASITTLAGCFGS